MVNLIQGYPQLLESINRIMNRPLLTDIDVVTDDFPREVAERLKTIDSCTKYEKLCQIKDQMLYDMLLENRKLVEQRNSERQVNESYIKEMNEWVNLTNKLTDEVNKLRKQNRQYVKEIGYYRSRGRSSPSRSASPLPPKTRAPASTVPQGNPPGSSVPEFPRRPNEYAV